MRVLFAGTPDFAVPSLEALAERFEIAAVLTNPDRQAGRGRKAEPSPVKLAALRLGLRLLQPERLDGDFREDVRAFSPDILVCAAFGRIFGPKFLSLFPLGGVNLHPSLLPRYRGPSPINAAILRGDAYTGISVQRLAREMDSGDIVAQESFPLAGTERASSLSLVLARKGAQLLVRALTEIEGGRAVYMPQNHGDATYCGLLSREDGRIDWMRSSGFIERMTRAYDPWPGAWTLFRGEVLRILEAEALSGEGPGSGGEWPVPGKVLGVDTGRGILVQTQNGLLAVRALQLQSKKAMNFASFVNGVRGFTGSVLGDGR
ncbi:MAG: methionyl-tRNA formyltransferase [Spirochaetales bacterium]|jgi:methionyl-tRNA formyltransferase|nr:methionyl-tRNA formyltransferase [Spirochaetales bacterium]